MAGLLDELLTSPTAQFGLGLLANNYAPRLAGRGAAAGNALQGGLLAAQQSRQQAMLEESRRQAMALQAMQLQMQAAEDQRPAAAQMAEYYRDNPWAMEQEKELKRAGATSITLPPNIKEGYEYVQGPNGIMARPVPGGPHDPLAPKPPTEAQRKTGGFLQRMQAADPSIEEHESSPGIIDYLASGSAITNPMVSEKYQRYLSAAREWIAGALRYESGAAVPETEFWRYFATYFGVPGDKPGTLEQKKVARKRMEDSLGTSAGPVMAPGQKEEKGIDQAPEDRLRKQGYVD